MSYNSLIEEMRAVNTLYPNRFRINKAKETIKIGDYPDCFPFSEKTYDKNINGESALHFINRYGMLKPNDECWGDELFYKGLKWNELSQEQKDSIINEAAEYADKHEGVFLEKRESWEETFNNNESFLLFRF